MSIMIAAGLVYGIKCGPIDELRRQNRVFGNSFLVDGYVVSGEWEQRSNHVPLEIRFTSPEGKDLTTDAIVTCEDIQSVKPAEDDPDNRRCELAYIPPAAGTTHVPAADTLLSGGNPPKQDWRILLISLVCLLVIPGMVIDWFRRKFVDLQKAE